MASNWKTWCRLCAFDCSSNIDINIILPESDFLDVLKKMFSINISEPSDLGIMICLRCRKTVELIIDFNTNVELDVEQLKLYDEFEKESIFKIDEFYETERNALKVPAEEVFDYLEYFNAIIETAHNDCPDGIEDEDLTNSPSPSEKSIYDNDQLNSNMDTEESIQKPNDTKELKCSLCKKTFSKLSNLRRHLKNMHRVSTITKQIFKCKHCEIYFNNKSELEYHKETQRLCSPSYICTICGIQLNSKLTLKRHMVIHSEVKRFKCDYCDKVFRRAYVLKMHLHKHTGDRYSCDFCDRTFGYAGNCRTHKKKLHPFEFAMEEAAKFSSHMEVPELKDFSAITEEMQYWDDL